MTTRRPPGGPSANPPGYQYPSDPNTERRTPTTRPPRRGAPPPQQPSNILLALVYGGVALIGLAVAAVTFVLVAPPTEMIRREIVAQVKSATGRDLTIGGGASFTLFPNLGVRIRDVTLSAPPGMEGEPFLTASSFEVGVRLMPLLRQKIVVDRLVLNEPSISLRVDAQGRKNWTFASAPVAARYADASVAPAKLLTDAEAATRGDVAQAEGATAPTRERRLAALSDVSLGAVRIIDGKIHYRDDRSGSSATVEAVNTTARLHSLSEPLDAKGSFVWAGEQLNFDATLTTPEDVLKEQPAKLTSSLSGQKGSLRYDGSLTVQDQVRAEGALNAAAPSLRELAAWLGTRLPETSGFGELSVSGTMRAGPGSVELGDAKLSLDGAVATGSVAVATGGARPHVDANLKIAGLNLANYVGHGGYGPIGGSASPAQASPQDGGGGAPADADPRSIDDLLQPQHPDGPQVRGYVQRDVWSDKPYDLSVLGLVDADARLSVEKLTFNDIKIDASDLTLNLKDRVLKTEFVDIALYEGRGRGALTLDGSDGEAAFGANFALSGIAAQPILQDASRLDWLAGTGTVNIALQGRGQSEATLMASLNGKANVAVRDGAIIGFNLAGAMRSISEGRLGGLAASPSEKTDFSDLTGSFVITDGIAKNEDLKLSSPLLRASGAGTVDLPQKALDYTVRPKLVATLSGQGGEEKLSGIEIPVHITGPWDKPNIAPDIAGAINNPQAAEALKQLGKELKGKNAGEIVDDLFSKGENGEPSKAQNLLKKFLGR
jgi:AsmA protein